MPIITELGRLRQEDYKFKINPGLHRETVSKTKEKNSPNIFMR
jgi:hypothetical protein